MSSIQEASNSPIFPSQLPSITARTHASFELPLPDHYHCGDGDDDDIPPPPPRTPHPSTAQKQNERAATPLPFIDGKSPSDPRSQSKFQPPPPSEPYPGDLVADTEEPPPPPPTPSTPHPGASFAQSKFQPPPPPGRPPADLDDTDAPPPPPSTPHPSELQNPQTYNRPRPPPPPLPTPQGNGATTTDRPRRLPPPLPSQHGSGSQQLASPTLSKKPPPLPISATQGTMSMPSVTARVSRPPPPLPTQNPIKALCALEFNGKPLNAAVLLTLTAKCHQIIDQHFNPSISSNPANVESASKEYIADVKEQMAAGTAKLAQANKVQNPSYTMVLVKAKLLTEAKVLLTQAKEKLSVSLAEIGSEAKKQLYACTSSVNLSLKHIDGELRALDKELKKLNELGFAENPDQAIKQQSQKTITALSQTVNRQSLSMKGSPKPEIKQTNTIILALNLAKMDRETRDLQGFTNKQNLPSSPIDAKIQAATTIIAKDAQPHIMLDQAEREAWVEMVAADEEDPISEALTSGLFKSPDNAKLTVCAALLSKQMAQYLLKTETQRISKEGTQLAYDIQKLVENLRGTPIKGSPSCWEALQGLAAGKDLTALTTQFETEMHVLEQFELHEFNAIDSSADGSAIKLLCKAIQKSDQAIAKLFTDLANKGVVFTKEEKDALIQNLKDGTDPTDFQELNRAKQTADFPEALQTCIRQILNKVSAADSKAAEKLIGDFGRTIMLEEIVIKEKLADISKVIPDIEQTNTSGADPAYRTRVDTALEEAHELLTTPDHSQWATKFHWEHLKFGSMIPAMGSGYAFVWAGSVPFKGSDTPDTLVTAHQVLQSKDLLNRPAFGTVINALQDVDKAFKAAKPALKEYFGDYQVNGLKENDQKLYEQTKLAFLANGKAEQALETLYDALNTINKNTEDISWKAPQEGGKEDWGSIGKTSQESMQKLLLTAFKRINELDPSKSIPQGLGEVKQEASSQARPPADSSSSPPVSTGSQQAVSSSRAATVEAPIQAARPQKSNATEITSLPQDQSDKIELETTQMSKAFGGDMQRTGANFITRGEVKLTEAAGRRELYQAQKTLLEEAQGNFMRAGYCMEKGKKKEGITPEEQAKIEQSIVFINLQLDTIKNKLYRLNDLMKLQKAMGSE